MMVYTSAERTGDTTTLLPDLKPANEGNADRELEIPDHEGNSGRDAALGLGGLTHDGVATEGHPYKIPLHYEILVRVFAASHRRFHFAVATNISANASGADHCGL